MQSATRGCAGASPDASPGLMRRRYSVPETIMRKYRLAQGKAEAEAECSPPATGRSAASASPPGAASPRGARQDRELMRRSALMRRLWGRAEPALRCRCRCAAQTRSLHGSRSELRPAPSHSSLDAAARTSADVVPAAAVASGPPAPERCGCADASPPSDGDGERIVVPYDEPLSVDAPPYELLEIVVSETAPPRPRAEGDRPRAPTTDGPSVDLDEYVSNILVESLNSLSDRLEGMSASVGGEGRISIVEKEIKVRLQNAGVNTIVHLSPTSNNPIIFGNEELCHGRGDGRPRPTLSIREERALSADSPEAPFGLRRDADADGDAHHAAVLHQIQQLFRDERPAASRVEASSVDAFLRDHAEAGSAPVASLRVRTRPSAADVIGGVGAGNYHGPHAEPLVPRFSACPHTDSMEVNASSSDEADPAGSGCASLVDSLDDPNSPRSILSRRSCAGRRTELVRSAIDVLDLLPENVRDEAAPPRDKAEAFFVKIRGDECECDRDADVRVADRMPDNIKERLHRRHRKREMRMESARRSRVKQLKREADRQRHDDALMARRAARRECMAIVNALIDEVTLKIAQDEYKSARAKSGPDKPTASKPDANVVRRSWRKDAQRTDGATPAAPSRNGGVRFETTGGADGGRNGSESHHIRGKLSLRARPAPAPSERGPRRVYQKSEIHEGNKCIEILEILEYVNGSQSSPETPTSDENHNQRTKKSRIPVPVHERTPRSTDSPPEARERDANANRLLADALLLALARAEAPPPRPRADSLRFRRTFDAIPEERGSLSLESGAEPERERAATRSAGTSPMAPGPEAQRDAARRSAGTQCERSARPGPERLARGPRAAPRLRRAPEPPPREEAKRPPESDGKSHSASADRSASPGGSSSDSADGGLLCPLAPRWLGQARSRRNAQRRRRPAAPGLCDPGAGEDGAGGWSVTVAGSCRAALPADVEMRLRFPHRAAASQECSCCAPAGARACRPPPPRAPSDAGKLTLTMKKEALDSSFLASKSTKKASELPELETYRASRSKLKSSVKAVVSDATGVLPALLAARKRARTDQGA